MAALRYAAAFGFSEIATVPCDAPVIPPTLVARLRAARDAVGGEAAFVALDGRVNPVFAIYRASAYPAVKKAFACGVRTPRDLVSIVPCGIATFDGELARAFADIDTAAELAAFVRSGLAE